jgi:hypothetical protein
MRHLPPPPIYPSLKGLESPDVCAGMSTSPRSKGCKEKERNYDLPVLCSACESQSIIQVDVLGFRAHSELVTGL